MRFLSVCSGIEAASCALEPLGFTPVGFAEIDKAASRVLAHHFGSNMPGEPLSNNGVPNFGDFTALDASVLGSVDMLIGGTPCQAFSVAGKRLSLADARGNLTLSYVALAHDLARFCGLRCAVWENVPGVLSTSDNAFGCLLGGLVGADYPVAGCDRPGVGESNWFWRWNAKSRVHKTRWPHHGMVAGPKGRAAWRVLDAQYFRLAQRRRRVFVVVSFGDLDPAAVLFERQGLRGNSPPRREAGQAVAGTLEAGLDRRNGQPNDHDPAGGLVVAPEISPALKARDFKGPSSDGDGDGAPLIAHALRGEGFDASEDGTGRGTPIVPVAFRNSPNCGSWETGDRIDALTTGTDRTQSVVAFDLRGREGGAQFEGPHETANIRAASGGSSRSYVAETWAVRRLTPTECERLQGFPDGWTAVPDSKGRSQADGPRYKQLGNSMAVPVISWIGRRVLAAAASPAAPNDLFG